MAAVGDGLPRLVFGKDSICPRCRGVDRRGRAYARGYFDTTLDFAVAQRYDIVKRYGIAPGSGVRVVCYQCKGTGVVRNESTT